MPVIAKTLLGIAVRSLPTTLIFEVAEPVGTPVMVVFAPVVRVLSAATVTAPREEVMAETSTSVSATSSFVDSAVPVTSALVAKLNLPSPCTLNWLNVGNALSSVMVIPAAGVLMMTLAFASGALPTSQVNAL